jgi:hypothetical protein
MAGGEQGLASGTEGAGQGSDWVCQLFCGVECRNRARNQMNCRGSHSLVCHALMPHSDDHVQVRAGLAVVNGNNVCQRQVGDVLVVAQYVLACSCKFDVRRATCDVRRSTFDFLFLSLSFLSVLFLMFFKCSVLDSGGCCPAILANVDCRTS